MNRINYSPTKKKMWPQVVLSTVIVVGAICIYGWWSLRSFTITNAASDSSVTTSTTSTVSDKKTVCLDPGHGGEDDPGAVNGDIIERDINLIVANKAKTLLELAGFRVVMTRTSNDDVLDNTARADYCNSKSSDIVVSIHHNDYTDGTTDYATAIYYKAEDQELAQDILDATSSGLNVPDNGLTILEDNVLVRTEMPAALSEAFFVSSDYEKGQIKQAEATRLNDEALALVAGVEKYFSDKK